MGLVEYSDSDSESGSSQPTTAVAAAQPTKKYELGKLNDRSNPTQILISLPSAPPTSEADEIEAPAAKRSKTSGNRFSGFSTFLPPPKAAASRPPGGTHAKPAPTTRRGLKTSSEATFRRDISDDVGDDGLLKMDGLVSGLKMPPPKGTADTVTQLLVRKPEDQVQHLGEPSPFKPLSVPKDPAEKPRGMKEESTAASKPGSRGGALDQPTNGSISVATTGEPQAAPLTNNKKSLFSLAEDSYRILESASEETPFPDIGSSVHNYDTFSVGTASHEYTSLLHEQHYTGDSEPPALGTDQPDPNSLDAIADDLKLNPGARRELLGRGGACQNKAMAKAVINFNMDQEYRRNDQLRKSGALDQQQHNPLRAIKPGKHSLQQLVNQVQSQRDALEENFAKNRATQKQHGAKYGF